MPAPHLTAIAAEAGRPAPDFQSNESVSPTNAGVPQRKPPDSFALPVRLATDLFLFIQAGYLTNALRRSVLRRISRRCADYSWTHTREHHLAGDSDPVHVRDCRKTLFAFIRRLRTPCHWAEIPTDLSLFARARLGCIPAPGS